MTLTKTDITKKFNTLAKAGFIINSFNSRRVQWKGQIGFCDHVIIGKKAIYLIEVKIGKDKIKDEKQYGLMSLNNNNIFLCNGHNTELIISYILSPCPEILNNLLKIKNEYCQKYLLQK